MNGRTALYRLYDSDDDLLYVGVTYSISTRWEQHAKKQPWWPQVTHQTVTWFDDRSDAEKSETAAIETEHPTYNIRGVKGRAMDEATGFPVLRRIKSPGFQEATSDEIRRDFSRYLNDTEAGVHTEILRYGEGVAAVVPCEWMDEMIHILRDLRQVEAGWDIYVPVERLREIARTAAAILPATLDSEMDGEYEDETQRYVAALKGRRRSLRDHRDDCHCAACRSLPGRREDPEMAQVVPLAHDDEDQGK